MEAPAPLEPPPDDVAPAFVPGELPDDYPPPPELDPIPETPEVVVTPSSPAPTAVEAVVAVEVEVSVNPEPAVRPILGVGLAVLSPTGTPTTYTGLRAYGGLEWSRISLLGAVLLFNLGVEIGQLAFVFAMLLVGRALRELRWARPMVAYAMGSVAAFWLLDRVVPILRDFGGM